MTTEAQADRFYRLSASMGSFSVNLLVDYDRAHAAFGGHDPKGPFVAKHYMGGAKPKDFIHNSGMASVLVSARVRSLFEEQRFTGWKTLPCEVLNKRGVAIATYYFLQVTGRCGALDDSASVPELAQYRPGFFCVEFRGPSFPEASWDGSDFFTAPNNTMIIVSERVKDVLHSSRVSGVELEPLRRVHTFPLRYSFIPRELNDRSAELQ